MSALSATEQRQETVMAVNADGRTIGESAGDWGISKRTMHRWVTG